MTRTELIVNTAAATVVICATIGVVASVIWANRRDKHKRRPTWTYHVIGLGDITGDDLASLVKVGQALSAQKGEGGYLSANRVLTLAEAEQVLADRPGYREEWRP